MNTKKDKIIWIKAWKYIQVDWENQYQQYLVMFSKSLFVKFLKNFDEITRKYSLTKTISVDSEEAKIGIDNNIKAIENFVKIVEFPRKYYQVSIPKHWDWKKEKELLKEYNIDEFILWIYKYCEWYSLSLVHVVKWIRDILESEWKI